MTIQDILTAIGLFLVYATALVGVYVNLRVKMKEIEIKMMNLQQELSQHKLAIGLTVKISRTDTFQVIPWVMYSVLKTIQPQLRIHLERLYITQIFHRSRYGQHQTTYRHTNLFIGICAGYKMPGTASRQQT